MDIVHADAHFNVLLTSFVDLLLLSAFLLSVLVSLEVTMLACMSHGKLTVLGRD